MKKLSFIILLLVAGSKAYAQCGTPTTASYTLWPTYYDVTYGNSIQIYSAADRNNNSPATITYKIENLDYINSYVVYYVNGSYAGSGSPPIEVTVTHPTQCGLFSHFAFSLQVSNTNSPPGPVNIKVSIVSVSGGSVWTPTSHVITWHQ